MASGESVNNHLFDQDAADRYGEMVAVQIAKGNFEGARNVIGVAETELNTATVPALMSRRPLAGVMEEFAKQITAMTVTDSAVLRMVNALEDTEGKSGHDPILYVHQLLATPREEILEIPNIGWTIVGYLTDLMGLAGFKWPVEYLVDQPLQVIVDDATAIRLQESGYRVIRDIRDLRISDFQQDLLSRDWLGGEIFQVVAALNTWLLKNYDRKGFDHA